MACSSRPVSGSAADDGSAGTGRLSAVRTSRLGRWQQLRFEARKGVVSRGAGCSRLKLGEHGQGACQVASKARLVGCAQHGLLHRGGCPAQVPGEEQRQSEAVIAPCDIGLRCLRERVGQPREALARRLELARRQGRAAVREERGVTRFGGASVRQRREVPLGRRGRFPALHRRVAEPHAGVHGTGVDLQQAAVQAAGGLDLTGVQRGPGHRQHGAFHLLGARLIVLLGQQRAGDPERREHCTGNYARHGAMSQLHGTPVKVAAQSVLDESGLPSIIQTSGFTISHAGQLGGPGAVAKVPKPISEVVGVLECHSGAGRRVRLPVAPRER